MSLKETPAKNGCLVHLARRQTMLKAVAVFFLLSMVGKLITLVPRWLIADCGVHLTKFTKVNGLTALTNVRHLLVRMEPVVRLLTMVTVVSRVRQDGVGKTVIKTSTTVNRVLVRTEASVWINLKDIFVTAWMDIEEKTVKKLIGNLLDVSRSIRGKRKWFSDINLLPSGERN